MTGAASTTGASCVGRANWSLADDALLAQQDLVGTPLDTVRGARPWFSGATVLGDGSPALIVDVSSVA